MRLYQLLTVALAGFLLLMAGGCASIFSPGNQKVKFTAANKDATISYNDDSIGRGIAERKLSKKMLFYSVEVSKEGYIPENYAFELRRTYGATALFALLDLPSFLLAPLIIYLDLSTPRVHRFAKMHKIPALTELKIRGGDEKYLLIDKNAFENMAKDVNVHNYSRLTHYADDMTSSKSSTPLSGKMEEMGLGDAGDVFVSALDSTLRKSKFTDTTKHIFTSADNTLYLDATIKNITINEFKRTSRTARSTSPNEALSLKLEIEWRVLDYYRQPVCITTTMQTSDIYTVMYRQSSYNEGEEPASRLMGIKAPMQRAIANNMTRSLAALQAELSKKGLLKKGGHGNDTTAVISLARPVPPGAGARLNEMLKSSVSIKTDDGHGSGVIVSEDGYIVTNYHVVAGAKSIEVIFNDDSKVTARVVRTSTSGDLALLKVEKDSLNPLPLSENKSPDLGVDAWAIGTPRSLELGQTISKGIISGIRTTDDLSYIQTDVKISPGNSGGALINRNGEVLGIISAKLIGFGTEGIGFAITSYQVLEKLKIAYK